MTALLVTPGAQLVKRGDLLVNIGVMLKSTVVTALPATATVCGDIDCSNGLG